MLLGTDAEVQKRTHCQYESTRNEIERSCFYWKRNFYANCKTKFVIRKTFCSNTPPSGLVLGMLKAYRKFTCKVKILMEFL